MLAMMLSANCSSRLGAVRGLPFSIFLNFEWSGLERLGLVPRQLQGENNTLCDKLAVLNVSQQSVNNYSAVRRCQPATCSWVTHITPTISAVLTHHSADLEMWAMDFHSHAPALSNELILGYDPPRKALKKKRTCITILVIVAVMIIMILVANNNSSNNT